MSNGGSIMERGRVAWVSNGGSIIESVQEAELLR